MENAEKPVVNRTLYLVAFVVLAAALLLGITAYFGANSARGTVGKIGNALDSAGAGNFQAALPPLNGSAAAGIPKEQAPAAEGQPNGSAAAVAQQAPSLAQNGTAQSAQQAQQNGTALAQQQNTTPAAKKEVTVDFLYADWCPHCQAMKPVVARVASQLPAGRLEVRYWNEASRGSNATVAAIYDMYTRKGYFQGFPTFVANGNEYQVGEMPEAAFKSWVCLQFPAPKPAGC